MLGALAKSIFGSSNDRYVKSLDKQVKKIAAFEPEVQAMSDEQLAAQTVKFRAALEAGASLDDLLPEAFATVKNAARRLCGEPISVCDHPILWEMVHYDVQLIGGMALHERHIAEMATGEGKTLVSTCPLYLNALSGKNCQLVTVNDYLALRDSHWMGALFEYLGLTVGCIQNNMQP